MSDALALALAVAKPRITTLQPSIPPVLKSAIGWYDAQAESTVEANGALNFIGVNEQFLRNNNASVVGYPYTCLCWFKANSTATTKGLICLANSGSTDDWHFTAVNNNGFVLYQRRDSTNQINLFSAASIWDDNQWHLMAAVGRAPNDVSLYVDNAAPVSDATSVSPAGINRTCIGYRGSQNPTNYFDGDIAQSAVYPIAITTAQFTDLFNSGVMVPFDDVVSSPANHWWLNDPAPPYIDSAGTLDLEAFGTTGTPTPTKGPNATPAVANSTVSQWSSRSNNPNHLTQDIRANQSSYVQVPWADGFRWAIRFDGTNDWLREGISSRATRPFYRNVLGRFRNITGSATDRMVDGGGTAQFSLKLDASNNVLINSGTNLADDPATTNYELMRCVYDTVSTIDRNGVQVASGNAGTATTQQGITIGGSSGATPSVFGSVDVLEVTDSVADDVEEVEAYYRSKYVLHWGDPADANSYQGPSGWWSASSIGNKTANDGSGNDVQDGEAVGFWVDCSGAINNGTEPTNKPTYRQSVASFAGRPTLEFAFLGQQLSIGQLGTLNNVAGVTLIAVAHRTALQIAGPVLFYSTGTAAGEARAALTFEAGTNNWELNGRRLDADSASQLAGGASSETSADIVIATIDYANGPGAIYVNGAATTNATFIGTPGNTSATNSLAASMTLWNGHMAQGQVFSRVLTANEISAIGTYLAGYYGGSWS